MNVSRFLFLLLVSNVGLMEAELFTSNAHLQSVLYAERDLSSVLKRFVKKEEDRLQKIRQLADSYKTHSTQALENIDQYLGNPIHAFLMIKRFAVDWYRDVYPLIVNDSWSIFNEQVAHHKKNLPTYEDLKGAASALMRLQDTYQLDTSNVAHGNLSGIKSPVLSAKECFDIGWLSYTENDYYHTVLWMEQALNELNTKIREKTERRLLETDSNLDVDITEILDYLAFSYYQLGDVPQALNVTNELLSLEPSHERAVNNKKYYETLLQDESRRKHAPEDQKKPDYLFNRDWYKSSEEFLTYEALCRGEDIVAIQNKDKLTCRYVSNNHPLLLLQPVKEETVHLNPFIAIYHNVINDEEISQIKELATPRLNRATVHNTQTGQLETASYRISKSAWLKEEDHQVIKTLNNRIAAITGLDLSTAEELQVANYGLGGQYEPHFDYARRKKKSAFEEKFGNRIATFLNYMSDVDAGGATVFPYIGLKLYPKKGNAAFWYNLHRSGEGIVNTRHAACPVLVGTKWIANKWIHERGQEFRRPCGLNADE